MAVHGGSFLAHSQTRILPAKSGFPSQYSLSSLHFCRNRWTGFANLNDSATGNSTVAASFLKFTSRRNSGGGAWFRVSALDRSNSGSSNYVVPLDASSCITRPLGEILRDLNKRIPDNIITSPTNSTFIPWYHANRMLSFYAPGWCGEVRDVIFSDNGSVTVVYRVTIRGSDGEAHRESSGTVSSGSSVDPVAAAEEIAFCRACARFGLGLYLYHDE